MIAIEVEDKKGNTICAFLIKGKEVICTFHCVVADVEADYLFQTKSPLIRIQEQEGI